MYLFAPERTCAHCRQRPTVRGLDLCDPCFRVWQSQPEIAGRLERARVRAFSQIENDAHWPKGVNR